MVYYMKSLMRIGNCTRTLLAAVMGALALQACEKVEAEEIIYEEKEKTIIIYMVSNNDLAGIAVNNINKILEGYIPADGNLAVYSNNFDLVTGEKKGSPMTLVNLFRDEGGNIVRDTIIDRFPVSNSATKERLRSVLSVVKTTLPAKEYGLIFWSHATGWLPSGYYSANHDSGSEVETSASEHDGYLKRLMRLKESRKLHGTNSGTASYNWPAPPEGGDPYAHLVKSFGSEENVEMPVTDLANAIPYKMDFIAFDACLMGGIETAYQLKDLCNYYIASPAEILADGFPYETVMKPLFEGDYTAATEAIYNHYANQTGENRSVTISLVKSSGLDDVAAQAKIIFESYRNNIATLNISGIQPYFRYNKHWFYDIGDFMDKLAGDDAAAFKEALEKAVVAKYTTGRMLDLTIDPARFSGISTYINNPANDELDAYYQGLEWDKAVNMISAPETDGEDAPAGD